MKKVIKNYTPLPKDELDGYVENFNPIHLKGYVSRMDKKRVHSYINEYDKQIINPSPVLLNEIENIIKHHVPNTDISYLMCRLNRVSENTNTNDPYHNDEGTGDIIFLHYPNINEEFEGGEFQWKDEEDNEHTVNVTNGLNLILIENPWHRVLNVTKGIRFSYAFFFNILKKKVLI
jgi:hypothetical protein